LNGAAQRVRAGKAAFERSEDDQGDQGKANTWHMGWLDGTATLLARSSRERSRFC
jgi:hypothetical protein